MQSIYHALVLNFHQPSGNLDYLLHHHEWEAKQILWSMDRMPRSLWGFEDIARVHLALSGTLLESLSDPSFQERVYGTVKCGDLLWHLQNSELFEILGTGYYHPVFALIPPADWDEQINRWKGIGRHLFWERDFGGFWPPEMGFCMEMIPMLKKHGFRYVLVDSNYVEPVDGKIDWAELRYRPHVAEYEGEEIIVVVRDRELSDAQESGMDLGWFEYEVHERTKECNFPPLVTTISDGDNGGWFRNTDPYSNFWDAFYKKLLLAVRSRTTEIRPIFIDEYLRQHGPGRKVKVRTGAWNTGWHRGDGFVQWTGSEPQKAALQRIRDFSDSFHHLDTRKRPTKVMAAKLEQIQWRLLRAETSCNLFWGEAWVDRVHADLDEAQAILDHLPVAE